MPLDEWQDVALEAAMGERSNGKWASKFVGMSVPRQNGKSQLIVARALAGVLLFSEKSIIISAHETDTAREVWKRLIDVIEDNPTLEARVTGRMDAINREFVSFGRGKDKQTIKLKARRASGSRGFSCDCLLLDEAQILGKRAWGSIVPTMSARSNMTPGGPQLWLFGTPPTDEDDPFAFSRVRESAIAKKARHCWLEWSALADDDFDAPATWAKANPAYGDRITREAVADDRAAMDDEQFGMERLGIWADALHSATPVVDPQTWKALVVPAALPEWPLAAIGLDMDLSGRLWASPAAHAGETGTHLELLPENLLAAGQDAAVAWLWERCKRRLPVVMLAESGARVLQAPLLAKGMKVYALNSPEVAQMSASLAQGVKDGTVSHLADDLLQAAVESSERADGKTGQWRIQRAGEANGAPLLAVASAHFGAVKWSKRRTGERRGRTPRNREAVVL